MEQYNDLYEKYAHEHMETEHNVRGALTEAWKQMKKEGYTCTVNYGWIANKDLEQARIDLMADLARIGG